MLTKMYIICLLLVSATAYASPFIVCDPYPTTAVQPDNFVVVLNGTTYNSVPVAVSGSGVRLRFDLAGKWITGANTCSIKAGNLWGESSAAPFSFNASAPAMPSNVGLEK